MNEYTIISMTQGLIIIKAPSMSIAWWIARNRKLTPIEIYLGNLQTGNN